MTVGGLANTVFCFNRPCECHLYTAPRNKRLIETSIKLDEALKSSPKKVREKMASLAEKHNKEVKRLIEMSPDKRREYEKDIPFRVPKLIPLADITLSELAEGLENTVYTSPKEFMKPRRSRRI